MKDVTIEFFGGPWDGRRLSFVGTPPHHVYMACLRASLRITDEPNTSPSEDITVVHHIYQLGERCDSARGTVELGYRYLGTS